jgi:nucleoside-diphosphate-sugar epimerase
LRFLVTGANGFLGRHVVSALCASGHQVRACVRPSAEIGSLESDPLVEVQRVDLKSDPNLSDYLTDVDAVLHLAAAMQGSDFSRFQETVTLTERLFDAMRVAGTKRLVLCSSFSVYDWDQAPRIIDEDSVLLDGEAVYSRGGYASAKLWQERLARRAASDAGWKLTIVRPGFIWGRGNECPSGSMGPIWKRMHFVFAPSRRLPFTHVENAADCLRAAAENDDAVGETLNLVDGYDLTAWQFQGEVLRRGQERGIRLGIPYWLAWPAILAVFRLARIVLGPGIKLPSSFMPAGFAQGYKPHEFSTERLKRVLGWRPPLSLEEAFEATFVDFRDPVAAQVEVQNSANQPD